MQYQLDPIEGGWPQGCRTSTGRLWAAGRDLGAGTMHLEYSDNNGATWIRENIPVAVANIPAIAIDSLDTLHISYTDSVFAVSDVSYITRSAAGVYGAPEVAANYHYLNTALWTHITVDSNDIPHIVYYGTHAPGDGGLRYVNRVGGAWSVPDEFHTVPVGTTIFTPYLKDDDSDTLRLVWTENDGVSSTALYSQWAGAGWMAPDTIAFAQWESFVLDGTTLQTAYYDTAGDAVIYRERSGAGVWSAPETVPGLAGLLPITGAYSITKDLAGTLCVVEYAIFGSFDTRFARRRLGGTWFTETLVGFWESTASPVYDVWPKVGAVSTSMISTGFAFAVRKDGGPVLLRGLWWFNNLSMPVAQTDAATVAVDVATINGTLLDDGEMLCFASFEYGLTVAYGDITSSTPRITGQTFSVTLPALPPGTYHFRARAANALGLVFGADGTFIIGPTLGGYTMPNVAVPLNRAELVSAVRAYHGYTTRDGDPAGITLVDSSLIGRNDFVTGRSIMILSGNCNLEMQSSSTFDPYTGTITLPAFSQQILAGTMYQILVGGGGGGSSTTSPTLDAVYLNTLEGVAGTAAGIGTATNPVNNITDAIAIMASRGTTRLELLGGRILAGIHTGAVSPTVMTDANIVLIAGRYVGWVIGNGTDGSTGVVTANTEHTITVAALTGGGLNVWTPGDGWYLNNEFNGTHTGGVSATVMTDSAANFSPSALIGQDINNVTDGSTGVILANTINTVTVGALIGGGLNVWTPGDVYQIAPNPYSLRIVPTTDMILEIIGSGVYSIRVIDVGGLGWSVDFLNGLRCGEFDNTAAVVTVYGDLVCDQGVYNGVGLGQIRVTGDLISGGTCDNLDGSINVDGKIIANNGIDNGLGYFRAGEIFVNYGEIHQNAAGIFWCSGLCEIHGEGAIDGRFRASANGATITIGSLKARFILNTSNSPIIIDGDCQISVDIINSGLGLLTVLGDLRVTGDDPVGEGYINNTGGNTITIGGNAHIAGSLTSDAGIEITGDLRCRNLISFNAAFNIYGDLQAPQGTVETDTGNITIQGHTYCGSITITGGGFIWLMGDVECMGQIESEGTMEIWGDCYAGLVVQVQDACSISVRGNLKAMGTGTDSIFIVLTGSLSVLGDVLAAENVVVGVGGTVTIGGVAHILGTITNSGTLTYMGTYPETAISVAITNPVVSDLVLLASLTKRYTIDGMVIKSEDPGLNTITIRLWKLVNALLTEIGSFAITTVNFGTYFSLMDMFGIPTLAGDSIQITAEVSAGGPYAVEGSYTVRTDNGGTGSGGVIPPI
jgi:hypothetical protein